jgi:hypothetical protein
MANATTGSKYEGADRFAVRFVHLAAGWRYWAFERRTGADSEVGLNPNGYGSEAEARRAIRTAARAA